MSKNYSLANRVTTAAIIILSITASTAYTAELDEVIVTATKRAESAQDVSMSIEVVSGDVLDEMAITDLGELSTTIPALTIGDGVTSNLIYMRGIGSGEDRSFEQSVSMFQDGIYMPRSRQTRTPFFDAERIEVLRGPQAVLFGLNSTAGAISVHSAKNRPGDDFVASLTGEFETEYSGTRATAIFGGSPTENLGLRFAVQAGDSGDGHIENSTSGSVGNADTTLARLTAVWDVTENSTITAKYDHADYELTGQTAELVNRFAGVLEPGDGILDYRNSGIGERLPQLIGVAPNNQSSPGADQTVDNFMVNLDVALGEHTLTALVGMTDYTYKLATDLDSTAGAGLGLPGLGLDATSYEEYEQTSAELRLSSPVGQFFEYVAGVYYQDSDLLSDQSNIIFYPPDVILPGAPFSERGNNFLTQDQTLYSAYLSATLNLSDRFRIIGGVRYSDDEKKWARTSNCEFSSDDGAVWTPGNLGGGACALASDQGGTVTDSPVMPELGFEFDLSDSAMIYGRYGESAKSGGAATGTSIPDGNIVYDDESAEGFEIGLKSLMADGAVRLNIAYFNNDFSDLQVKSSFAEGVTIVTTVGNAGQASSDGFEVEFEWALNDVFTLGASVSILDAVYDDYKGIACNSSGSTPEYIDNGIPAGCDASGFNLPFAPDSSGRVYANFDVPLGTSLSFFGNVSVAFTESYFTDQTLEPTLRQDSFERVDARLGIGSADNKWSLAVIGKNLSDEPINMSGQPLGAYDIAYLMLPMTLTVQGILNFGS